MASQPPPGYNPEASLLQGGTAPIHPVQGGGGGMEAGASLPAGYNPDQSLLNTGSTAPIVAIRGGGKEGELAYQGYILEHYDPPLSSIALPALKAKEGRQSLNKAYLSLSKPFLKELKSFVVDPVEYVSTGNDNALYKICPTRGGKRRLPAEFFQGVRKRVVIVDKDDVHLWILSNLQGNVSKFLQTMKLIPKGEKGNILPNHIVVLVGNLFSANDNDNILFYEQFLEQKIANMENLFYLNYLTETYVTQSCTILNNTYSTDYLSKEEKNVVLPTFGEPDFIILKKQQIVLKNSELPFQQNNGKISITTVLEKPDVERKYKSFLLVPMVGMNEELNSNSSDAPLEKKYFLLDSNPSTKKLVLPTKSDILCPKDQTCSNFKGGYTLEKIQDDKRIDTSGLYHIYKNTDKMPFLKNPGSTLSPEEIASLTGSIPKPPEEAKSKSLEEAKAKALEGVKTPEELEAPVEAKPKDAKMEELLKGKPLEFKEKKKDTPFQASPTAVEAKEQDIEVNAKQFLLRIPLEKGVRENWIAGKYSENEVQFLESLQFTPQLLSDTFGAQGWKVRLANFLESLLLSNCFQDTILLTNLECSNSQQFVKQVYMTMYNRLLSELYDEMGMIKPKTLADLFVSMKELEKLGPTIGKFGISKYDFTGDLLERFQTIHFDKKTGLYSADFAELTDATRELLQKMKIYRVSDSDIEEITKAILERMKISVPSTATETSAPPPPPPPPPSDSYTIAQIKALDPAPSDFFTSFYVEPDGLCFPRAVLKSLMDKPVADTKDKKTLLVYLPNEADSLQFVREIREYIRAHKAEIKVKNFGATGEIDVPVQQYFEDKYKAKNGEDVDSSIKTNDRIRVGTVYKKLSLDEYLNLLDDDNKLRRPFSEVNDAGIGTAAAKLKSVIIVIYNKTERGYNLRQLYNEELGVTPQPLSKYVFLEWTGGNHYNLLKVNPGKTFLPLKGGFLEEDMIAEELIDLGEVIEEAIEAPQTKRNKYRKQTYRNKNNKRNASRKHSQKRK